MTQSPPRSFPQSGTIGWIGTGIMGSSIVLHLLKAGYTVNVFNRTKSKTDDLIRAGAVWRSSPFDIAANSDAVFLMVGYPHDVRETVLGENGVLNGIRPGGLIVDMTTSSPSLAVEIETACRRKNVVSLDVPVSGGDVGAKKGTLSLMIGGDEKTANDLMPLWKVFGQTIVYHGPAGSGQHAKMVNQTILAGNMIGLCEGLLYARRAGLDWEKVLSSVSTGAAGSWTLSNMGPRILQGDFAPGFMTEHFLKDLRIVLDESKRMNIRLRGAELAEQFYAEAVEQGCAADGSQRLYTILERYSP
ncbi:MAG: NAD(P)-dependent oxidoreductase [Planctomycetaceae bacterium]|jgi:3-hydroxyisobutyrate dehydrogenase|nr:NAD(P)-dependent oxidoreductase [Planctomycetaceae bacterium]